MADGKLDDLLNNAQLVKGAAVITAAFADTKPDSLRMMGDKIRDKMPNAIGVLVGTNEGKSNILCVCGKEAISLGAHAGKMVKEIAAVTGGKGGGKPDSAMAGVGDSAKIGDALAAAASIIEGFLK